MNVPLPSALILDCAGTSLAPEEKKFFAETNPYGFILFARNCETPAQVKALVAEMKATVGRAEVPILIDQEGGRVVRLKPPHFRVCPPAGSLAALGGNAARAIYLNGRLIAHELSSLGINVDCAPVADLLIDGAHSVIGERAYGRDPETVAKLAAEMARGLIDGGVIPVLKHIPGHGRAKADSHHELPSVETPLAELERTDFAAFKKLSHLPMGMTAHVLYKALDDKDPATLSPAVIRHIREKIGFDGLLMSDEITMKALSGSIEDRAKASLAAGCDVVMYCNGITMLTLEEKRKVAAVTPPMSAQAMARSKRAFDALPKKAEAFSAQQAEAELEALMRRAA